MSNDQIFAVCLYAALMIGLLYALWRLNKQDDDQWPLG